MLEKVMTWGQHKTPILGCYVTTLDKNILQVHVVLNSELYDSLGTYCIVSIRTQYQNFTLN